MNEATALAGEKPPQKTWVAKELDVLNKFLKKFWDTITGIPATIFFILGAVIVITVVVAGLLLLVGGIVVVFLMIAGTALIVLVFLATLIIAGVLVLVVPSIFFAIFWYLNGLFGESIPQQIAEIKKKLDNL